MYQSKPVMTYYYNPKNIPSDVYEKMVNVLTFEVVNYIDVLNAANKGTFGNRIITIDPLRRKKNITDFNYNDYVKKSVSLNGSPVTNNDKNALGKTLYDPPPKDLESGAFRLMIANANQQDGGTYTKNKPGTVQKDYQIEKTIPNRVAQLSLASHTVLKITVPGNPSLIAGTCVVFNLSSSHAINSKETRPIDPYLSGKYLVTAVRHIISPASYVCIAEISKDSGLVNYTGVNNDNSMWKK